MQHRIRTYVVKHWRGILNIVTALAMTALVITLREQIFETLRTVQQINYLALLLIPVMQLLNYDAYARMYGAVLKHVKQPVRYRSLYRVQLELNFVNNAFPSGGISGISFFGLRLRKYGVKGGTATLVQLMKFIFVFISFQLLIGIGLLVLAAGGNANNLILLIAGVLATLTVVATSLLAFVVGSKKRIDATFTMLTRGLNRIIHLVRPKHPETINITKVQSLMADAHQTFQLLKSDYRVLRKGLLFGLIANVTEILTLYVVYLAFGEVVNIGAVIIAYAIANFAGTISVLPGGIGIYEALMTAALAAGGIPAALSIPVVVTYRVLNMTLQLAPGWFLYHNTLQKGQPDAGESENAKKIKEA